VGPKGANWVVGAGLEDGDQVIVSGLQLAQPGGKAVAKPVDSAPPKTPGTPAPAASPGDSSS
jgi:membrane fusion protein (multidrug efflux system)